MWKPMCLLNLLRFASWRIHFYLDNMEGSEERIKALEDRVTQLETLLFQSEARVLEHFKAFSFVVNKRMKEMERFENKLYFFKKG